MSFNLTESDQYLLDLMPAGKWVNFSAVCRADRPIWRLHRLWEAGLLERRGGRLCYYLSEYSKKVDEAHAERQS